GPAGANIGISSTSNSGGSIVIGLGTPVATSSTIPPPQNPTTGITFNTGVVSTFDLDGVLLSANGKSGEIDATMTETSGNLNLTSPVITVITADTAPLVDPALAASIQSSVATNTALPVGAGDTAILNSSGAAIK